jgi:excisionase family DNA binding protein
LTVAGISRKLKGMVKPTEFLLPGDVARMAEPPVSTSTVRDEANKGRLPFLRTSSGLRIFRRADVERWLKARAQARLAEEEARRG